jgi:hypothetical protein
MPSRVVTWRTPLTLNAPNRHKCELFSWSRPLSKRTDAGTFVCTTCGLGRNQHTWTQVVLYGYAVDVASTPCLTYTPAPFHMMHPCVTCGHLDVLHKHDASTHVCNQYETQCMWCGYGLHHHNTNPLSVQRTVESKEDRDARHSQVQTQVVTWRRQGALPTTKEACQRFSRRWCLGDTNNPRKFVSSSCAACGLVKEEHPWVRLVLYGHSVDVAMSACLAYTPADIHPHHSCTNCGELELLHTRIPLLDACESFDSQCMMCGYGSRHHKTNPWCIEEVEELKNNRI